MDNQASTIRKLRKDKRMSHHIIKCNDYEHIPSKSMYNYNYYRHKETREVILEILHEDENYAEYYNMFRNPTFTNRDFKDSKFLGFSNGDYIGCDEESFEIDTDWT